MQPTATLEKNYAVIEGLTLPYTMEEIDAICDAAELEIENGFGKIADDAFYKNLLARVFADIEAEKNGLHAHIR